jgi:hypothetical protein
MKLIRKYKGYDYDPLTAGEDHSGNKKNDVIYFLEHIFKKMGSTEIVVSSVRPSVRLSPIFQPL